MAPTNVRKSRRDWDSFRSSAPPTVRQRNFADELLDRLRDEGCGEVDRFVEEIEDCQSRDEFSGIIDALLDECKQHGGGPWYDDPIHDRG